MTDGPDTSAARWAPDPHDPNQYRWWDGGRWTDQTSPVQPPAPSIAPSRSSRPGRPSPGSAQHVPPGYVAFTPSPAPDKGTAFRDRSVGPIPVWAIIIAGIAAVIGLASLLPDDEESSQPDDLNYSAFVVCKDFVDDQLKSPGSAVFRDFFEDDGEVRVTGSGEGPYTVRSSVDSENGFGALLRSEFVCEVRRVGEDRWNLVDLSLTP